MELHRALGQIEEIHAHLVKTEVYRGYRSIPVAIINLGPTRGDTLAAAKLESPLGTALPALAAAL